MATPYPQQGQPVQQQPPPGYAQQPGQPYPQQQQQQPGQPYPQQQQPMGQQMQQPQQGGRPPVQMMPPPTITYDNCPPGLEYLGAVDQILVHQQVEMLEAITGFETENKYQIKNSMGQQVFFAAEISGCCARQCLGPARPFQMKITDNLGQEVLNIDRPFRFSSPWAPFCCPVNACWLNEMVVSDRNGILLGYIRQEYHVFLPSFGIYDSQENLICTIKGPFCRLACLGDINFEIFQGEQVIGKISKQWSGLAQELFTDADNFGVQFPMAMSPHHKGLLVSAVFLIDFLYFEDNGNNQNNRGY